MSNGTSCEWRTHLPALAIGLTALVIAGNVPAAGTAQPGPANGKASNAVRETAYVAILPTVEHASHPAFLEYGRRLGAMLHDQLAIVEGLHVIGPQTTAAYAGANRTSVEIGIELGAELVVESSVKTAAGGHRLTTRVLDTASGETVMAYGWTSMSATGGEPGAGRVEKHASSLARDIEYSLFPERRPDRDAAQAREKAVFLDTTRSEEERMKALKEITPARWASSYPPQYIDGGAALSGAVALAAAQIAAESDDANVRARIWQTMAGVNDSALIQPLLHALEHDSVVWVRLWAARALTTFADQAIVRDTLELAAREDEDARVRQAAHEAMLSPEALFSELRQTYLDELSSQRERSSALYKMVQLNESFPQAIDDELETAIVRDAGTSPDPLHRQSTWFMLRQLLGAGVVGDLVQALQTEENEAVRESLVDGLRDSLDEPGVLETIKDVRANDPSPQVRAAAERVLQGD